MNQKKVIKSFHWQEFEIIKEKLFENKKMRQYISLHSTNFDALKNKITKLNKVLRMSKKNLANITNSIKNLDADLVATHRQNSIISSLDRATENITNYIQTLEQKEESVFKSKRGKPVQYPLKLSRWIYNAILIADSDPEKLRILIKFFRPKGEFDLWIRSISKDKITGLQKKIYDNEAEDDVVNFKWLNKIKNHHKELIENP